MESKVYQFILGQKDCRDGKPHQDKGEDYNAGYNAQYTLEAVINSARRKR